MNSARERGHDVSAETTRAHRYSYEIKRSDGRRGRMTPTARGGGLDNSRSSRQTDENALRTKCFELFRIDGRTNEIEIPVSKIDDAAREPRQQAS